MPRAKPAPAQTATHMAGNVRPLEDPGGPPDLPLPQDQGPDVDVPQASPSGPAGPLPGELEPLNAPGDPQEPITAGLGMGPGPGPEAQGAFAPQAPTVDMEELARYLPTLELLSMQPGTSQKVRNMVRLLKSQMSPELIAQPPVTPQAPQFDDVEDVEI